MPLSHRGYGAYISCDGQELEAYRVKKESDTVVSCYIASEAGKEFKVHWVDSKPPSHLSLEVRMDGSRMGVLSHTKNSSQTSNGGFRIAIDARRSYQFAPLITTADDDLPSAYNEELGTIELRLRRVLDFVPVRFTPKTPSANANGPVHERSWKGNGPSHRVSLGKEKEVKPKSTILRPLLIDDKSYVIFRFYYRPKEYLRSRGLLRGRLPTSGVPSSISSSGRRRKRPSSAMSPSLKDGASKRQCTTSEDNIPIPMANDFPVPMEDEENNQENVVEIHLSAKDNYAIPRSNCSPIQVKQEEMKRRSSHAIVVKREVSVKREPSPVVERQLHIKREPSSETVSGSSWVSRATSEDGNFEMDSEGDETLVEIHLSSKDCRVVRNDSVKVEVTVKAEISDVLLKRELSPG